MSVCQCSTIKPTLIAAKFINQTELTAVSESVGIRSTLKPTLITAKFVNQPELTTFSESVGINQTHSCQNNKDVESSRDV